MLCLGLNTAGPACDIAIVEQDTVRAAINKPMTRGQDEKLPGLVHAACEEAGARLHDISRIGVVTGPGSFTGVRIGVAFARGLALSSRAQCLGITSLEAALPAGQQGSAIVVLPAQRRAPDITYWAQTFRTGAATSEALELPLDDLTNLLKARPHIVFGDADDLVQALSGLKVRAASPTAIRAAELAASFDVENHPPTPTYVRKPDALLPGGKSVS